MAANYQVTERITMNVGEYIYRSLPTNYINYSWRCTGEQVAINSYENMGGYANNKTEYTRARICAVKPGICYVTGTAFSMSQNNQVEYIYEITVKGSSPASMVMQHQLHLEKGNTHTLSPRLLPSGASSSLTWYSSNTSVATVSSTGVVTAKAVGDATITCISANGLREDCNVTVTPTMVSSLSLNHQELRMDVGDQCQLSAVFSPENATYKQLTWKSMNPDVVSVDENGMASCISNGWSVILATTVDGSNLTAGCFVQVGASDVDGDGGISIGDVTWLIDYLLHS